MSFYGKDPTPQVIAKTKRFRYTLEPNGETQEVLAHNVYFYDSGHIGFWNDRTEDSDGRLVLAVKALSVWEAENA
jgi:hypothetical protein